MKNALGFLSYGLLLGCFTYFVACSSGSSGGAGGTTTTTGGTTGSTSGGVTYAVACQQLAQAECTQNDTCRGTFFNQTSYGSGGTSACIATTANSCLALQGDPLSARTPNDVVACANAYTALSCNDYLTAGRPAVCATPGAVQNDNSCFAYNECASAYCLMPQGSACGTCQPPPQPGDDCSAADNCGNPNLSCVSDSLICTVFGQAGASCNIDYPCALNTECVGNSNATTCVAVGLTVGAPCDPNHVTLSNCSANAGLSCDPNSLTCVTAPVAAIGAACGTSKSGRIVCDPGPTGSLCFNNVCTARIADGQPCVAGSGSGIVPCVQPERCVTAGDPPNGICSAVIATDCN